MLCIMSVDTVHDRRRDVVRFEYTCTYFSPLETHDHRLRNLLTGPQVILLQAKVEIYCSAKWDQYCCIM